MTNQEANAAILLVAKYGTDIPTADKIANIHSKVHDFAIAWEFQEGYKPAAFQKAIAMQRLERGQTVQQIIDALVAMRVQF